MAVGVDTYFMSLLCCRARRRAAAAAAAADRTPLPSSRQKNYEKICHLLGLGTSGLAGPHREDRR